MVGWVLSQKSVGSLTRGIVDCQIETVLVYLGPKTTDNPSQCQIEDSFLE